MQGLRARLEKGQWTNEKNFRPLLQATASRRATQVLLRLLGCRSTKPSQKLGVWVSRLSVTPIELPHPAVCVTLQPWRAARSAGPAAAAMAPAMLLSQQGQLCYAPRASLLRLPRQHGAPCQRRAPPRRRRPCLWASRIVAEGQQALEPPAAAAPAGAGAPEETGPGPAVQAPPGFVQAAPATGGLPTAAAMAVAYG